MFKIPRPILSIYFNSVDILIGGGRGSSLLFILIKFSMWGIEQYIPVERT